MFSCLFREIVSLDMASASSVQVVMVIEPLIQYSSSLFPEGNTNCLGNLIYIITLLQSDRCFCLIF